MNFLKKTLVLILILGSFSLASTFEQNGVKEGNSRISMTLLTALDEKDRTSLTLDARYGYFLTDNIELLLTSQNYKFESVNDLELVTFGGGLNFYFLKTPVMTPYIGITSYHYIFGADVKNKNTGNLEHRTSALDGWEAHLGLQYFLNENFAVTPIVGSSFFYFDDYRHSYANLYLSYFF